MGDKGQSIGVEERVFALAPYSHFGTPRVPVDYVRRPRLFTLLDRGASSPLTLVSAPAGWGKTSLVADWVRFRASDEQTDWVTFERDDQSFWPGVSGALVRLGVAVPSRALPAGAGSVGRRLCAELAREIEKSERPITLVLDDYEMSSKHIAHDLDYLLRHSGPLLHLVLVTRVDPILPLSRYRLEDSLTEVRMADLAFTDTEAEELMRSADLTLSAGLVQALNERTQGWVAGLRFASRFLGRSEHPDAAIARMSGDTGEIGEYLMGEVLAAQTPENRKLLLSTSIPATIQPGLAETLGGPSATRTLALLARANTFVEPVPEYPGFYRYHPFFRDLLRAELAYEAPQEMERLQRAAALWFAGEGRIAASVAHYAGIGAWAEAAQTVVDHMALSELLTGGSDDSLAKMLTAIPDEVRDPSVSVVRAALALGQGDTPRVTTQLAQLPGKTEEAPDQRGGALSLAVAVLHSIHARSSDDAQEAFALAEEAEEEFTNRRRTIRAAHAEHELAAFVFASKGIAAVRRGELSQAHDLFTMGAESALSLGATPLWVECQGYLALIACLRDELSEAASLAIGAIAAADDVGLRVRERSAAPEVALAWVDMERYDLAGAKRHVVLASMSDAFLGDRAPATMLALTRSRVRAARGDVKGAISIIAQVTGNSAPATDWLTGQLRFESARLKIRNHDLSGAVTEVEGLERTDPAEAALVAAEVRLADGDYEGSGRALPPALAEGTPRRVQVAAWLVEATRQLRHGSSAGARAALDRSLGLAAAEGLRRPFRETSPAVMNLLSGDSPLDRGAKNSTNHALTAKNGGSRPATVLVATTDDSQPLVVDRLTEKELEVLGHLAELLTTEEIAEVMFVSVNTIRTHVRNILRKLGVRRRNAAIRRARELQFLPM